MVAAERQGRASIPSNLPLRLPAGALLAGVVFAAALCGVPAAAAQTPWYMADPLPSALGGGVSLLSTRPYGAIYVHRLETARGPLGLGLEATLTSVTPQLQLRREHRVRLPRGSGEAIDALQLNLGVLLHRRDFWRAEDSASLMVAVGMQRWPTRMLPFFLDGAVGRAFLHRGGLEGLPGYLFVRTYIGFGF